MRSISGFLAILCFVVVIGTVGAAEQATMPLVTAGVTGFGFLALCALFAWLAGLI